MKSRIKDLTTVITNRQIKFIEFDKFLLIFSLIIFSISSAAPSVLGGRGLFKVEDAATEDVGVISISTYLLSYKYSPEIYYSDWVAPNISYTPISFAEIFFWTGRIIRTDLTLPEIWQSDFKSNTHDKLVGGKLVFTYLTVFKIGGKITYAWPRNLEISVIESNSGFSWAGLVSLKFSELYGTLPNLIFNYGENPDLRNYRAGLEIAGSGGAIFVEATSSTPKTTKIFKNIFDNLVITPGIRLRLGTYSYLSGGLMLDSRKSNVTPDYTAIIGLTIGGAILQPPRPKFGMLTGTVTDVQTGASLEATISFPDKPTLKPIKSNSLTGIFKAEKIPAGTVIVDVIADGYQKQTMPILIEANKINAYDFKLKSLVTYGVIAGNVYDAASNRPLNAEITFSVPELRPVESDRTTGAFRVDKVPTGIITVTATKDGYYSKAVTITVDEGKVSQIDLPMVSSVYKGTLIGKITDKLTGKPLVGTITFRQTELAPVISDSLTGVFQIELPVRAYPVVVSALGYTPISSIVTIERDKITETNFELYPEQMRTTLMGKVADKKTGLGLKATIRFPEVALPIIQTDSITGIYRSEVPVGSYLAEISADGYITQTAMIVLSADKPLEKNFELVKKGMVITLKGVYFESGKATIKPESYPALQDAAKVLTDNPKIKVEIQGHTDNVGSASFNQTLSEKRAYAVMEYLVKTLGIAPERLIAKGYGFTKPIASNETPAGRALNRRVDFVILEQE